ncbi:MAG: CoA pyrophosphatase [Chloroflexi bacterium]|nr:CoA pyrophosphatase [Chloroflexota bacterium]MCY3581287.1 CoA pyrophosphatase [Chloroflexota bacterium]MCY3716722.1 CoA pyrophosphatase [Chloroflexota bacterium]MDE2649329.1 CoA pyrophosphatase [Chloroflexota bacterium]MXX49693.1 CoA pyrophosphatase [Chloroflexota bacterium]
MSKRLTFHDLRRALRLDCFDARAAQGLMAPKPRGWEKRASPPKQAAVMILVFADAGASLHSVLTLRNADLRGHSGQVSFPGGGAEPVDRDALETARRETVEEIGICAARVQPLGRLANLYIPASHYDVTPVVAKYAGKPAFAPNDQEVAEVFTFTLDDLLRPELKAEERRQIRGVEARVPYYAINQHKVWGATAIMLSELEGRLLRARQIAASDTG